MGELGKGSGSSNSSSLQRLDILTALYFDVMMTNMRTTVTLDPDVEQLLRDAVHRNRASFKETLNQAIRIGLAGEGRVSSEEPFVVKARPMGLRTGIDPARLNQLNDELEIDAFLATTRHRLIPDAEP